MIILTGTIGRKLQTVEIIKRADLTNANILVANTNRKKTVEMEIERMKDEHMLKQDTHIKVLTPEEDRRYSERKPVFIDNLERFLSEVVYSGTVEGVAFGNKSSISIEREGQ